MTINISKLDIRQQIITFWEEQNWSNFDIIMYDYRHYCQLKISKKVIKCMDRQIKKLV